MKNYLKKIYLVGIIFTIVVGSITFLSHKHIERHFHEEIKRNVDFPLNSILKQVMFDLDKAKNVLSVAEIFIKTGQSEEKILSFFQEMLAKNDSFFSVFLITAENNALYTKDKSLILNYSNITSLPWFNDIINGGKLVLTEPYLNDSEDLFIFTMAQPIYDDNNNYLGVVGVDKSLQGMIDLLKNEKASENGYSLILNRNGYITMCPSCEYKVGTYKNIVNVSSINDPAVWEKPEGLEFVTLHGRETGYLKWQTIDELGLVLATFAPVDDFISKQVLNTQLLFVTLSSFFLIFLFLFFFLKRYIIYPMKELAHDIMAISMDDPDYRLPFSKKHLFGTLRNTLNQNLEKTQLYFENIISQRQELGAAYEQLMANEEELENQYKEIKGHRSQIQYLADYDPLTGLYNRRKFNECLGEFLEDDKKGSIFLLDLDDFKNINDIHGHAYGDKILKLVAQILEESLCPNASVYRFGGDEFLIVVENIVSNEELSDRVKVILSHLSKTRAVDGKDIRLTASIGIVRYPIDGKDKDVDELLSKADIALHNAKKAGKNVFLFFENNMASTLSQKVQIKHILHETMQAKNFVLLYQPIINSVTGDIAYLEALIRIQDISISPAIFIPIAEESGLIIPIGRWVIKEAIQQLVNWQKAGKALKPIAINFSPKQFYDTGLADYLHRLLKQENVDPALIEVEITESVLIDDVEEVVKIVKRIRSLGIKVSLDDFGTGYSSINYITRIPVNRIKLDRRLTEKLTENAAVLKGLIAMAHGLKMEVVGEGVEELEEAHYLREVGCNYLQGYLFSVPVPPEKAGEILNANYGKLLGIKE